MKQAIIALVLATFNLVTIAGYANQGPGLPTNTFAEDKEFTILSTIESRKGHGNVAMVNGYLMVIYSSDAGGNDSNGGIEFWDISNPESPTRVYRHDNADTHGLREAHGFSFSSSYSLNGSQADLMVAQGVDGIQFWDLTDPSDIELLSYLDLPAIRQGDYTGAWWVFWQPPYVYVAGTSVGLLIVDATDPTNPRYVKTLHPYQLSGVDPAVVFAVGNLLILADVNKETGGKYVTMDISDPADPILLQTLTGEIGYSHIFADGKIFVSGKDRRKHIDFDALEHRMHVYTVDHNGGIHFERSGDNSLSGDDSSSGDNPPLGKGGYGSYQDGYFISGFSEQFAKYDASTGAIIGTATTGLKKRDEDFGMVLGNLVWIGDDHGKGTGLALHDADPDTTPPTVTWMHPAPDSTNQSTLTRIGLSMSDNIDVESLGTTSFMVRPLDDHDNAGDVVEGHYSAQGGIVNFSPSQPLAPNTRYEVVVNGVKDWAGNRTPQYLARFTTGAATRPLPTEPEIELPVTGLSTDFELVTISNGYRVYIDRTVVFDNVPSYLVDQPAIITRNDGWSNDNAGYLEFDLTVDSDVYVLFDGRATALPRWLADDFDRVGDVVEIRDSTNVRAVYKRVLTAGRVRLGGASALGSLGVRNNYTVVVVVRSPGNEPPPGNELPVAGLGTAFGMATISAGSTVYTDRTFTFGELPSYLDGQTAIITPNDDKRNDDAVYLEFDLTVDSEVYVLFDERATARPRWLADDFEAVGDTVEIDGDAAGRDVYKRVLTAGRVQLGGPGASGASHIRSNYTVVVVPLPGNEPPPGNELPVAGLGTAFGMATISAGSTVYTDRTFTFGELPSYLDGQTAIITPNDDKRNDDAVYLEFDLTVDSEVYVLFDERATARPRWLADDFEAVGDTVEIDGDVAGRDVYKRVLTAGRVQLGGPGASGASHIRSNYTVVVVPLPGNEPPPGNELPVAGLGTAFGMATISAGSTVYTDRTFTFGELPSYLDGQTAIITPNDDKRNDDAVYLEFDLTVASEVYVLFDERATARPRWLADDFEAVGDTVEIDGDVAGRDVYRRVLTAGRVQLGGAGASGASHIKSNYTVVVAPIPERVTCTLGSQQFSPVEVGTAVTFAPGTVQGGGGVTYSWSFGDGSDTTEFNALGSASYVYSEPGRYFVALTVKNAAGQTMCSALQVVYRPKTTPSAVRSASIVYDDVALFNVNPDNDTVSAVTKGSNPGKLWEAAVGDTPTTLMLAGDELWVVNQDSDDIHILRTSDGSRVQVVEMTRGTRPFGIVASPDGQHVYVTAEGEGELHKYDIRTRLLASRSFGRIGSGEVFGIPAPTMPGARGIAVSADSSTAYVGQFRSKDGRGTVYKVDTSSLEAVKISLAMDPGPDHEDSGRGVPNYINSLTISPDGLTIKIPSVKANVERGMFRDGQELTFETRVRTIVSHIDTASGLETLSRRIDLGDRDSAKAIDFSQYGEYYAVVFQGNNLVELRDSRTNELLGSADTGEAPRDVRIDGSYLYVHNFLDRSVSVFDISGVEKGTINNPILLAEVDVVGEEVLAADVLSGKRIFYRADERMSQDGYISCASCHLDGGHDGLVWDFTQAGEGLRNTVSLHGRAGLGHGNVHWTANFDEIQDFENDIRNGFGGQGFLTDAQFEGTSDPLGQPKAGLSVPLDQLAAYVASLDKMPDSPYRYSRRFNRQRRNWGKQTFDRNCAQCHSGPDYTDKQRHDVGTVQPSSGKGINLNLVGVGFETPTLKGLWDTAPYFHNGQAPRLVDTLRLAAHGNSSSLTSGERAELVHFLLSLDDGPPFIDPTIVDFARIPRGGAERPHVSQLSEGSYVYADSRSVVLSDVPDQFVGKTLVSTYWADRRTTEDYLRFTVVSAESGDSVTSQVCVAFDEAAEARPDWLRDWAILPDTRLSVLTGYAIRRFPILCKHFEPGAITLGGNMAPGARFPVYRFFHQYIVFVTTG